MSAGFRTNITNNSASCNLLLARTDCKSDSTGPELNYVSSTTCLFYLLLKDKSQNKRQNCTKENVSDYFLPV